MTCYLLRKTAHFLLPGNSKASSHVASSFAGSASIDSRSGNMMRSHSLDSTSTFRYRRTYEEDAESVIDRQRFHEAVRASRQAIGLSSHAANGMAREEIWSGVFSKNGRLPIRSVYDGLFRVYVRV